jgi:NAD(P)-dependent dehydrogenase (short-subunit alcohol dehydrogenase family)
MADPFSLAGRTALITGASSGLGRHFARVLARAGARVAIAARRLDALEALADAIGRDGGQAHAVPLDVTDPGSVAAAIAAAGSLGPIQILVNNAGTVASKPATELAKDDWDRVIETNLTGAFLVARETAKSMRLHAEGGSIVNIASILGLRGAGQVAAYAASKAGLIHLTRVLALEWARHGIRVNALAPGYIETDLNRDFFASEAGQAMIRRIPQRRLGRMEDLDGPLLLLASDASRFMTGSVITVDGGHTVSSL